LFDSSTAVATAVRARLPVAAEACGGDKAFGASLEENDAGAASEDDDDEEEDGCDVEVGAADFAAAMDATETAVAEEEEEEAAAEEAAEEEDPSKDDIEDASECRPRRLKTYT
jgi:hypothetical protein